MVNDMNNTELFCDYYKQWIEVYKKDAVREATMAKYQMTWKWVEKLIPDLKVFGMAWFTVLHDSLPFYGLSFQR